jgi:hypothetical protein
MNKRTIIKAAQELPADVAALCPEFAETADTAETAPRRTARGGNTGIFKRVVLPLVLLGAGLTAAVVTAAVLKRGGARGPGGNAQPAKNTPGGDNIAASATESPATAEPHGKNLAYTPNYDTRSTLHVYEFKEILARDGYHRDGVIDKNYNVSNAIFSNITPKGMLEENPDVELFYSETSGACFLKVKNELYRFDTFGGYHRKLCYWDYDGNGVDDLVSMYDWGSGMAYLSVAVVDLTTMEQKVIHTVNLLTDDYFSFEFDGDNIYIAGKKCTYSHGLLFLDDNVILVNSISLNDQIFGKTDIIGRVEGKELFIEFQSSNEDSLSALDFRRLCSIVDGLAYYRTGPTFDKVQIKIVSPSGSTLYETEQPGSAFAIASTYPRSSLTGETVNTEALQARLPRSGQSTVLSATLASGIFYDYIIIRLECEDMAAVAAVMNNYCEAALNFALEEYERPCCVLEFTAPGSDERQIYAVINAELGSTRVWIAPELSSNFGPPAA